MWMGMADGCACRKKNALINGLDFVLPMIRFDDESFIANIEALFTSMLDYTIDKDDCEEKKVDDEAVRNLTPHQLA
ncbi:unnamed protein product [Rotaria sp. Silwood1]|nr:unnamed protein product [Rotaria sp. Silwood1]CAF1388460.1 unnamed protein product [Rotaria sp. Silwood1]CAF3541692.1 unnamed protein product [Rotaria sp. Silwood1]CAF4940065.1 unnamed protein product [Rotaria sp. Silwood1]CAF5032873.1 unnamed protein product [Rotaria sp. Silwood1]